MKTTPASLLKWGLLVVAGIVVLLVLIGALVGPQEPARPAVPVAEQRAGPTLTIDERLLPVLNAEIASPNWPSDPSSMEQASKQLERLAARIVAKSEWQHATAVNVMMLGNDKRPWLHLTLPVALLRTEVRRHLTPVRVLNLSREVGFNTIDGERAARSYCAGTSTPFCNQIEEPQP